MKRTGNDDPAIYQTVSVQLNIYDSIMRKLIYFLPLLLTAVSCSDLAVENVEQDNSQIEISVSSLSFLNSGEPSGDASVTVTSSGDWILIGKTSWIHPSSKEGKSGETVTFTADPNPGIESRTEVFSFVCGSRTEKLYIMQKSSDAIELYKDSFSIPMSGGQIAVRVSANDEVSVEIPAECAEWVEQVGSPSSKSLDLNVFYFNIQPTDEYADRICRLGFTAGETTAYAEITQDRKAELRVDKAEYQAGASGNELKVTVHTNLAYSVSVPDNMSSWLKYTPDPQSGEEPSGLVERVETFLVKTSPSAASRAAMVVLKPVGADLSDASFVIVQKGTSPVYVDIPDANFRKALASYAYIIEGEGTQCEVTEAGISATALDISGRNISDITGIEYFTGLKTLNCRNNNIRKIDLSKTGINITYSSKTYIDGNPIEDLKVNSASNSLSLQAKDNYYPDLLGLTGADGTSSTSIKITGEAIMYVYLANNTSLKMINLYNCPSILGTMYCSFTNLTGCSVYLNPKTKINNQIPGVTFYQWNPEQ